MTGFSGDHLTNPDDAEAYDPALGPKWRGVPRIIGPKWSRMPLLTVGMFGLQIVWSFEMGYASPYLLSLGLSKSLMSIVFVAGPLSGLIVQPLIGVFADRSKSSMGRRRPYMLAGCFLCAGALLLFGFTRDIASVFASGHAMDVLTIILAIWSVYCIDFSINAVQAADRSLVVDTLPGSEQEIGNAWCGFMFGLGSVFGFFIGNVEMSKILPFLGRSQIEVLAAVTCFILIGSHAVTAFSTKEKVLLRHSPSDEGRGGFLNVLSDIVKNIRTLPPTIRQICIIQFFAWIAWFPLLFFATVWVGEFHTRAVTLSTSLPPSKSLEEESTRFGNRAMFYSSVVSLLSSIITPLLVVGPEVIAVGDDAMMKAEPIAIMKAWTWLRKKTTFHLATVWAFSHLVFASAMMFTFVTTTVYGATFIISVTGFSWAVTQWAPFSLLAECIKASSRSESYEHIPIPLRDARTRRSASLDEGVVETEGLMTSRDTSLAPHHTVGDDDFSDEEEKDHDHPSSHPYGPNGQTIPSKTSSIFSNSAARLSRPNIGHDETAIVQPDEIDNDGVGVDMSSERRREENGIESKGGMILGIHNIFIVIPQFLVTAFSSIMFAIFEPDKSVLGGKHSPAGHTPAAPVPGNATSTIVEIAVNLFRRASETEKSEFDSIGLIFRIGGFSAAIAAILSWRLARRLR